MINRSLLTKMKQQFVWSSENDLNYRKVRL